MTQHRDSNIYRVFREIEMDDENQAILLNTTAEFSVNNVIYERIDSASTFGWNK